MEYQLSSAQCMMDIPLERALKEFLLRRVCADGRSATMLLQIKTRLQSFLKVTAFPLTNKKIPCTMDVLDTYNCRSKMIITIFFSGIRK